MTLELFFFAVLLLAAAAIFDLMVGVGNDAVNFLNSAIGSRVATRAVILSVASLGVLAGVGFSSGMMEVARKGIFHPQLFTMPELMLLFLAVMLTDVILLDTFNSMGLPTSTTVSIVFELLGAAVVISILKISQAGESLSLLSQYINSAKATQIIFGILLSILVAFICGAAVQIVSRLLLTFDYESRLRKYGAVWGGLALASITYFILVKGAKGSSFITPETTAWILDHTAVMLLSIFAVSAALLQVMLFLRVNILRPIVLIGTFALAMAFAANDLVNFIGVPMAGYHAYKVAAATDAPLEVTMDALSGKVQSDTVLLLIAGAIMVGTLWISRKARSVTETSLNLGQQSEREERFESMLVSRLIVRSALGLINRVSYLIPAALRERSVQRLEQVEAAEAETETEDRPAFDLVRASVTLMVASAVISYATSKKLPLSTTYVTFMVAMGTSFADRAWGRDSAVYRVSGVITVIGGWFMTAMSAFLVAGAFAMVLFKTGIYGLVLLLIAVPLVTVWNHRRHRARVQSTEADEVFNLKKVSDVHETTVVTFGHMAVLLHEIRRSLDRTFEALFEPNESVLRRERNRTKDIQRWSNVITANIFKALRLMGQESADSYARTARRLQRLAEGHRDVVVRVHTHVSNNHAGLLDVQVTELREVQQLIHDILLDTETIFRRQQLASHDSVSKKDRRRKKLASELSQKQIARIQDNTSKTRLSILFYAIIGNVVMLGRQSLRLVEACNELFGETVAEREDDLE
jgi:hypothetical protein